MKKKNFVKKGFNISMPKRREEENTVKEALLREEEKGILSLCSLQGLSWRAVREKGKYDRHVMALFSSEKAYHEKRREEAAS